MALKQVILHVGLHKTATTSFQITCANNRKQLKGQGIHYPQFEIDRRKINNHSVPIFSLFCDRPERYNINIMWGYSQQVDRINAAYQKQLDTAIDTHTRILLSGEDISALPPGGLEAFKRYLIDRGCDVRVLCGVRRPYSSTCSGIQQKVRGGILGDFEHSIVPQKCRQIKMLKNTFDNIEFFSFEADCRHPAGPIGALLERVGVDYSRIKQTEKNEGLGNISTRLYADINKIFPVLLDGKLNPLGRDVSVTDFDETRFLLTPQELSTMKDAIDKENREYCRLLGEEFTDSTYPTSDPFFFDLEMASKILKTASRPSHVREAVEDFLCRHSDNSWNKSDLVKISLPRLDKTGIARFLRLHQYSLVARVANLIFATIQRNR